MRLFWIFLAEGEDSFGRHTRNDLGLFDPLGAESRADPDVAAMDPQAAAGDAVGSSRLTDVVGVGVCELAISTVDDFGGDGFDGTSRHISLSRVVHLGCAQIVHVRRRKRE
jgi:hypothetical protein